MKDPKEIEIIRQAGELFMRNGIKSMTMDAIAAHLKISKKTLYKYFRDKKDLVKTVMQMHCETEQEGCLSLSRSAKNAIEEIIMITKHVSQMVTQIHPSIHYDLEHYYVEAWNLLSDHKAYFIYNMVKSNLERGIKEGLYRKNLHADIIAKIYVEKIDIVFNGDVFPPTKYKFEDVHFEMMRYHIRGVASREGMNLLKEIITKENINL